MRETKRVIPGWHHLTRICISCGSCAALSPDSVWCSGVNSLEFITLPSQSRPMGLSGFENDPVQRVRLCDNWRRAWADRRGRRRKARNSPCANQLEHPERQGVQRAAPRPPGPCLPTVKGRRVVGHFLRGIPEQLSNAPGTSFITRALLSL